MNTIGNDYGLTPDEIQDEQFIFERGTATDVDGEIWWSFDQFVRVHCPHVGNSVHRLDRLSNTLIQQSGEHTIEDIATDIGTLIPCLPRSAALRYLADRKKRAKMMRHRRDPDQLPPHIQLLKERRQTED